MGKLFNSIKNALSTEPSDELLTEEFKLPEAPKPNSAIKTTKIDNSRARTTYTPGPVTNTDVPRTTSSVSQVKPVSYRTESTYRTEKPANAKVIPFEPKSLEDTRKIIEYLDSGYAVLLNLESNDKSLSQRIVDVVSGALYLIDGDYQVITEDIYLMAPKGVEITSPLSAATLEPDIHVEKAVTSNNFTFKK